MKAAMLVGNHKVDARRIARAQLVSRPLVDAARSITWSRLSGLVLIGSLIAISSLPVWLAPRQIAFKSFGITEVANVLMILVLVALLAERALEIFVGTWRSPGASQLDLAVQKCKARLEALPRSDEQALDEARAALEEAKSLELRYRCVTRQIALATGLVLGFLVSGVGVRALGLLVDPSLSGSPSQEAAFRLVDGLLTGGVIAGGSEGIHRVATVFDNFMSATARRAKGGA